MQQGAATQTLATKALENYRSLLAGAKIGDENVPVHRIREGLMTAIRPRRTARNCASHLCTALALCTLAAAAGPAQAQRINNKVAIFSALDKVTARISKLEVPINETVRFGSLKVTPRVCYSRPPEVRPKTTTFVEVDEIDLSGDEKRLFAGWMFAESPGLNALEHPVFDVWLTGCGTPDEPARAASKREPGAKDPTPAQRRRVRRRIRR